MRQCTIEDLVKMTNVKFRVTSEQNKTFQELFFSQGGSWINKQKVVILEECDKFLYIDVNGKLTRGEIEKVFICEPNEEVEIIDSKHFKNQQEIFEYLLEKLDNKIIHTGNVAGIVGFNNGLLWDFVDDEVVNYTFARPINWKPFIPEKWYVIDNKFTMCKVSNSECTNFSITPVMYRNNRFIDLTGYYWDFAEPVSLEVIKEYLL